jgi:hypothetical protein
MLFEPTCSPRSTDKTKRCKSSEKWRDNAEAQKRVVEYWSHKSGNDGIASKLDRSAFQNLRTAREMRTR